jgi:hypothetical protein
MFVGIPEDPRDQLIKQQMNETAIRLRISYEQELRSRSSEITQEQHIRDLQLVAANQKSQDLKKFGNNFMDVSCFPQCIRALDDKNYDSDYWEIALAEFNNNNGSHYDESEFWNIALEWYTMMGETEKEKMDI